MPKNLIYISFFISISLLSQSLCDTDDWLHVNDKAQIVDSSGKEVWLTGINWFGFATGTQVFDGVWARSMKEMFTEIADHGFNFLRLPVSTQILLQWKNKEPDPTEPKVNKLYNPDLLNDDGSVMYSFDIFNKALEMCKELGIKVMIDVHSANTDSMGHMYALWYNEKFSTEDWIEGLAWIAGEYKDDDTILAYDLKNEPHGKGDSGAKWDESTDLNNWKYAAEQAGKAVLAKNPNVLIMVEGCETYARDENDWNSGNYYWSWWGGNLRGVKNHPIDLGQYQNKLVYSPHDYGPLVSKQSWFHEGFTSDSIMEEYWHDNWFYILEEKIAPLLIGEWGGFMDGGPNEKWMGMLRDLMVKYHIHHTFWCFNQNSGDTGGMVMGNFDKWDEEKYALVKPALWNKGGQFISLDHKIPLGSKGISLSQA